MSDVWQALVSGVRELPLPGRVQVRVDGAAMTVDVQACLRLQPGRRAVLEGNCELGPVILKVFCGPHAQRHQQREQQGVRAMLERGIPTPALHGHGRLESGFFLVFEALAAQPIDKHCDDNVIASVMALLARMHNTDLLQTDLHLGNFLQTDEGGVVAIDGDGIRQRRLSRTVARRTWRCCVCSATPCASNASSTPG